MNILRKPLFWILVIVLSGFMGAYLTDEQEQLPFPQIEKINE
ncbi:hypothetical protein P6P90_17355 [Ectobacillus antri]|jgi:hypothetical protein|uniref:Uncharacterized protein n=1 Tax=Ectobacillus antri TaxID=2486280 RepID=A0ABT6H8L5_9BACI|nr:hypothetical protein [Ectobacillus antri]MDG4658611.1 hypothetical protein [Ectobacillus antri]MDG5755657.1 hypothetical protein [Ectobacillus antri]